MTKKIEKKLQDIKKIVDDLDSGEINLDDSVELYKKGIDLVKKTYQELEGLEQKITVLVESAEGDREEAWDD